MLTYDDAIPGPSNMPPPPPPASTSITASDFSSSASEPRPVTTQRGKRSTKRKTLHSKKGKAKGRKKLPQKLSLNQMKIALYATEQKLKVKTGSAVIYVIYGIIELL